MSEWFQHFSLLIVGFCCVGTAGFGQHGNATGWFESSTLGLVAKLLADTYFSPFLSLFSKKKKKMPGGENLVYQQGAEMEFLHEESGCRWVCKC